MKTPQTKEEFFALYGKFAYVEAGGGRIKILDNWPEKNLVIVDLPLVGKHTLHKEIADDLMDIFKVIQFYELPVNPIYPGPIHWDGCYMPRHKMWNPTRQLSIHSWGCAVDLNANDNLPGTAGNMSPKIVELFESRGWSWGGRWHGVNCDPMHFSRCKEPIKLS